jgi:hypothetical protein
VSFPDLVPDAGKDRCIQVRDVIPAFSLTAGRFVYEIELYRGDERLTGSNREFHAVAPVENDE